VRGESNRIGVTIHLVDQGVDTGRVLYQATVAVEPADTILTYQWVQLPHALPLLERAIGDALAGRLAPLPDSGAVPPASTGPHYFPPTLWSYLWTGLTRGIW
jgi:methionyl-tRNA formyltransferase